MIRTTIRVTDHFAEITEELERRVVRIVDFAAEEGAKAGEGAANKPKAIARFTVIPARNTGNGYAAGVKGGPLTHIFDKGSLGKRTADLKRDSRKPSWEVNRGENPFTAHRHDVTGKGVSPRNIFAAARRAAREAMHRRLLSR